MLNFIIRGGEQFPPLDSIRKYANDQEYDTIYIAWMLAPGQTIYLTTHGFHTARDSLSKRFNISPKVYGRNTIWAYQILPDADTASIVKGMIQSDKDWYESKYYNVSVLVGDKHAKATKPTYYNGNRVLKSGRSR